MGCLIQLQPGGRISLRDAAAVFAHYDLRPLETPRAANQRARTRFKYAIEKGILDQAADGSFSSDDFVAWATSVNKAMRGQFSGFKEREYVGRINGKVVAYVPGASVVMEPYTNLEEANRQAVLDKLLIRLLRKKLARYRMKDRQEHNRMRKARRYKQARQSKRAG